jgi:uncharacterized membrane protein YdbT with pleckstrin-like domain
VLYKNFVNMFIKISNDRSYPVFWCLIVFFLIIFSRILCLIIDYFCTSSMLTDKKKILLSEFTSIFF